MPDKFLVMLNNTFLVPSSVGEQRQSMTPQYFLNFWFQCNKIARKHGWEPITVANTQLRLLGGRLIQTKTQGWYLRWDTEAAHTMFVLKWS